MKPVGSGAISTAQWERLDSVVQRALEGEWSGVDHLANDFALSPLGSDVEQIAALEAQRIFKEVFDVEVERQTVQNWLWHRWNCVLAP